APRAPDGHASAWLSFAAAGRLLVASREPDLTQTIWDLETSAPLALEEPARAVHELPADAFLVTANGSIRRGQQAHVREARTLARVGKPLKVTELRMAAATADGTRVVLANSYWLGTWDAKTGERLHARFAVYG